MTPVPSTKRSTITYIIIQLWFHIFRQTRTQNHVMHSSSRTSRQTPGMVDIYEAALTKLKYKHTQKQKINDFLWYFCRAHSTACFEFRLGIFPFFPFVYRLLEWAKEFGIKCSFFQFCLVRGAFSLCMCGYRSDSRQSFLASCLDWGFEYLWGMCPVHPSLCVEQNCDAKPYF